MKKILHRCLAASLLVCAAIGQAQEFPSKPIRLVVPYGPGQFPDTMARLFGTEMSKSLLQPIVVDNRQGGGGIIGSEIVAKAAPDGYTLLLNDVQLWAITPLIMKSLPIDPYRDFAPVSILATTPNFLAMNAALPTSNNLRELVAFLRAHPGKYNYGTPGIGTIHHFTTEALLAKTGLNLTHVPYKGGAFVIQGLAAGELAIGFGSLLALPQFVQKGTVKIVAVATAQRSPAMPDVPTFAEMGVDDIDFPGSMGLLAPSGTPSLVLTRLASAVQQATRDSEVRKRLAALSITPVGSTPAEMAAWIKRDIERYTSVARAARIEPQ